MALTPAAARALPAQVSLEGLKPTVTFECAAKSSKGSKKKSGSF